MTTPLMANGTRTSTTRDRPAAVARAERNLRRVLGLNAATSLGAGLVALLAAPWTSDLLGVDAIGATRLVGLALVVFAVDVALVARAGRRWLAPGALAATVVDLAWVAATAVVIGRGATDGTGTAIGLVMAVGVLDFAVLQLWFRSRLGQSADRA